MIAYSLIKSTLRQYPNQACTSASPNRGTSDSDNVLDKRTPASQSKEGKPSALTLPSIFVDKDRKNWSSRNAGIFRMSSTWGWSWLSLLLPHCSSFVSHSVKDTSGTDRSAATIVTSDDQDVGCGWTRWTIELVAGLSDTPISIRDLAAIWSGIQSTF